MSTFPPAEPTPTDLADANPAAAGWVLLRERQVRETHRAVYRAGERLLVKQFTLPANHPRPRTPWLLEDRALRRLDGDGAPRGFGFTERTEHGRRIIRLVKEYVPGRPLEAIAGDDLADAATLLASLHRRGVVTDDANAANFLRADDGRLLFLDFGRARIFDHPGPRRDLHLGRELAKLFREGLHRDRAARATFLPAYFAALGASRPRASFIRAAMRLSAALRVARKTLTFASPWS